MDRNSNLYTFIFAVVMVVVVAAALAFTATTLKPLQAENVRQEKMQNILSTIGVNVSRKEASEQFSDFVQLELALNADGTVNEDVDAFAIELIDQKIRESDAQLRAAKATLASLIQRQRSEQRLLEALQGRIETMTRRAQDALAAEREELARQAADAIASMENEAQLRQETDEPLDRGGGQPGKSGPVPVPVQRAVVRARVEVRHDGF